MTTELAANGKPFVHHHGAHCETAVTSALFRYQGVDISEPMVFGIGSGIFFGHLPFLKMTGLPITAFRAKPGAVFRKAAKRLGVDFVVKTFRDPQKGMDELKQVLKTGQIVGLATNLYWLPYMSERHRWNFSGHNIIALREIEGGFRVSDPTIGEPVDCTADGLEQARFVPGPLNPRGHMYYINSVNLHPDLRQACIKGMKDSCNAMLKIPLPIFGVRGIRFLAKKVVKSLDKLGFQEACRHLAGTVRWVEETGTGGAGFRYMYAAFLQEAAELFGSDELADLSKEMTAIGDNWREFSVTAARIIKQRGKEEETFAKAGRLMLNCADREETLFKNLQKVVKKLKA
ncbi:MAG: BtrH N-terminal domain-containing protein [Smithellaceae bacterium]|nr:BtrH N-terminal domain-containing protein [Smithellaceae bacterium]